MTTSATNGLGRDPSKKVKMELLGKTKNEKNRFVEGLWKTSLELEVETCHKRKQLLA